MLRLISHIAYCGLVLVLTTNQVACGSKKSAKTVAAPQTQTPAPTPVTATPTQVQPTPITPVTTLNPASLLAGNYVLEKSNGMYVKIDGNLALTTSLQMPFKKKGSKKSSQAALEFAGPLTAQQGSSVYFAKGYLKTADKERRPVMVKVQAPTQANAAAYVDVTLSLVVFGDEALDYPAAAKSVAIARDAQQNLWSGCDDDCDDDCDHDHRHHDRDDDRHDDDECDDDDDCDARSYEFRDFSLRFMKA